MRDSEDAFTFRKWNPVKKMVPYGGNIEGEEKNQCFNPLAFFRNVDCCINRIFDHVIDVAIEGKFTVEQYLHEQESKIGSTIVLGRVLSASMMVAGLYLVLA